MRRAVTMAAAFVVFAALALAESWTGRLVDSSCLEQQQKAAAQCPATDATTSFALIASGKVYRLDDDGNSKAATAIKSQANRSANPDNPSSAVTAKVTGTADGNVLKVETIEIK